MSKHQQIGPSELDDIAARVISSRSGGNGFHPPGYPPGCRFRVSPPGTLAPQKAKRSILDRIQGSSLVSRLNLDERLRKAKESLKAINSRSKPDECPKKAKSKAFATPQEREAFLRKADEFMRKARAKMKTL